MIRATPIVAATASIGDIQPPPIRIWPKAATDLGSVLSGVALVRINIAPENKFALASVTMKLLTPLLAIVKPLSQPSDPPRTNARAQAMGTDRPATCIR